MRSQQRTPRRLVGKLADTDKSHSSESGFGRRIEAAGPADRSGLGADLDAAEVGGVAERLEDSVPFACGEVDVADF